MERFQDKVVFVTGGASGMGEMMVRLFAAEGAKVVAADINEEALSQKWGSFDNVSTVRLNVTSDEEWAAAMKTVKDQFGKLDILVNNAGISTEKPMDAITIEDWRRLSDINGFGTFLGLKHALANMKDAKKGSIVNISSYTALIGMGLNPYSASKGSVRAISRAAAAEYGQHGIRVNTVFPGVIETPMVKDLESSKAVLDMLIKATPLQRLGQPEDVAKAVLFLASDDAAYISGAELVIDGGYSAR
ncbi:3-alpha-hydroxysteroid dehydrogenase [Sporosarcina sp. NCCP-2222]|uniref:SDR family NAD(P)-dependent oxidoreductase n=1 Tax=Sporosarcina sp. NCCP-2222 TaxID=2935073 RepID=UPI00207DC997|nr:glucose 1-dehydrogenase [Sporosarcina sp. NCCP-2222]GKV56760.1 3-alpha-hydroxysteroid dehydrogenase [Sporosarcina sp. NCCP-2222]